MAVLMWGVSLMLMALLVLIGPRRTRAAGPGALLAAQPAPTEAPRSNPRVAVQTSAALLAIALALDVSSTPTALAAPVEADGVYSAAADELYVLPEAAPQAWTSVEMASDWAYKALNATDGWLL